MKGLDCGKWVQSAILDRPSAYYGWVRMSGIMSSQKMAVSNHCVCRFIRLLPPSAEANPVPCKRRPLQFLMTVTDEGA
ncbi:hypothetical protein CDAR_206401 [Caerostris darwini]|uniref:Uncharacterized protein n=1 Tax=Caerostris darwini TaxID=1538125 RepID=A0AAV4RJ35_9ARAC|nr:hypothetical protein CDAR_206401 [Caerostris darwini]